MHAFLCIWDKSKSILSRESSPLNKVEALQQPGRLQRCSNLIRQQNKIQKRFKLSVVNKLLSICHALVSVREIYSRWADIASQTELSPPMRAVGLVNRLQLGKQGCFQHLRYYWQASWASHTTSYYLNRLRFLCGEQLPVM